MRRAALPSLSLAVALAACKSTPQPDVPGSENAARDSSKLAAIPVDAAAPVTLRTSEAEQRARAHLQAQLVAGLKHDVAALQQTFADDSIIIVRDQSLPPDEADLPISGGPDGVSVVDARIVKLVAGGTRDAVWFYAEVQTSSTGPNQRTRGVGTLRVVELLAADREWKAVAASFTEALALQPRGGNTEIRGATGITHLARLAAPPAVTAQHLASDAIVIGPTTEQLATHAPANALARWTLDKLALHQRAREVTGRGWALVQATADHPRADAMTDRLHVQLFAVPDGTEWKVVLVQYTAQ